MLTRRFARRPWLWTALAVWLAAVGAGLAGLWAYAETPGAPAVAPSGWPAQSMIQRTPGRPTFLLFAHPQCACSQATVGELAILLAHAPEPVDVHVLFARPAGEPEGWERGDLWADASAIPGVSVAVDIDGGEAARFGARVSGQTLFYDGDGRLLFSGGITSARGHQGDNDGRGALTLILNGRTPAVRHTHVFGCLLHNAPNS